MHPIGWLVVVLYALLVLGIGTLASRRQKGTDDYFRGSRRLPWWALGISIIATAFSAASLLGGPGEGYTHGLLWLQLQLGDLLGYGLVCVFLIPVFVRLDLTTAYEYLEERFDGKTRTLGALSFVLFVIVRLGALLYGAAIVVAEVAGIPLTVAIVVTSCVAIVYTMAGGLAAVVWTDVLQFAVVLVGITACLFVVDQRVEGGLPVILATAREAGRLQLLDLRWDPASLRTLPTALVGYGMLAFAVAGTNQQSVQRYVACSDARAARKAALLAWATGCIGVAGTLVLGVFLYAFYQSHPGLLPAEVEGDRILPVFIARELPGVLAGVLAAAVFAAAMSSIDSALHSLSTCLVVDFFRRRRHASPDEARDLRLARGLVVICGLVGIGAALYVARTGKALLPFLATYTSYFVGPLLGLFMLGLWVRRARGDHAFLGACAAALFVALVKVDSLVIPGIWSAVVRVPLMLVAKIGSLDIPGIWTAAVSAPLTLALGTLLAFLLPAKK